MEGLIFKLWYKDWQHVEYELHGMGYFSRHLVESFVVHAFNARIIIDNSL